MSPNNELSKVKAVKSDAQVVTRVTQILNLLGDAGPSGVRLLDVAQELEISRPTAHRILKELGARGFVRQVEARRYALGSALYHLGIAAPSPVKDLEAITRELQQLADRVGDTCYVAMRSADSVYYISRATGSYPIQPANIDDGQRVHYSRSYCGLALLAVQGEKERERAIRMMANLDRSQWDSRSLQEHQDLVREAMEDFQKDNVLSGTDLVVPGVAGVAVTVPHRRSRPFVAVSVSAVADRLDAARAASLVPLLRHKARQLAEAFY